MTSPIDCVMGFLAGISVAAGVWAYYMEFVVCAKIERALCGSCTGGMTSSTVVGEGAGEDEVG